MFCPECGADVRAGQTDEESTASERAWGDERDGGERGGDEWSSGASGDDFDWGGASDERGDDAPDRGVEEPDGSERRVPDEEDLVPTAGDDASDEPTRVSRPPDSNHPEPLMGTEGDVVGHRIGAFLVDRVLLVVLFYVPLLPGSALESTLGDRVAGWLLTLGLLAGIAIFLTYTLLLEGLYGQTPGKRLFGIVVVKEDGSPCTVGASVVRSLGWILDRFFLYMVGLLLIATTDRSQRLGDILADTVVVRTD